MWTFMKLVIKSLCNRHSMLFLIVPTGYFSISFFLLVVKPHAPPQFWKGTWVPRWRREFPTPVRVKLRSRDWILTNEMWAEVTCSISWSHSSEEVAYFHISLLSFLWAECHGVSSLDSIDRNTPQEWSPKVEETWSGQPTCPWVPTYFCALDDRERNFCLSHHTSCEFVAAYSRYHLRDWSTINHNTFIFGVLTFKG